MTNTTEQNSVNLKAHKEALNAILIDKVVEIKPIIRKSDYYSENHDGAGIFTGAVWSTTLPIDTARNQFTNILTSEEQEVFEKEFNRPKGTLDFYNRQSPFWSELRVVITKDGLKLNLKEPMDFLKWKILSVSPKIAPSWAKRFEDARYRFAIVEPDAEIADVNKRQDKTRRAYKAFGKIEDSSTEMADLLRVAGKQVPSNAKADWLTAEIGKLIETNIDEFLNIVEDPNFQYRLIINQAVDCGALKRVGKTGFKLPALEDHEQNTADNLVEMIEYLKDLKNQPQLLKIKAQISNSK